MQNIIGFWGYPHPDLIKKYKSLYPQAVWVDLDVDFSYPDTKILPDSYCKIIKNIIDNSFYLKNNLLVILAPIGKDKCDSGWFAYEILKDLGFKIEKSIYEEVSDRKETPISKSNLPLRTKFEMITANIIANNEVETVESKPKFGFWGVPPNDLSILELFPCETHIYGWTKCVEAGVPADIELEMSVEKEVPTVFYSQAFCSKAQLAKYLADKYNGLYIDIDDFATNSVRAKIEAFLRLR